MTKRRTLGVTGLGHVGAHVAYALAAWGVADELILVDKNGQKLRSEVQDSAPATSSSAPSARSSCCAAPTTG